jgi:hypothetical protein
LVAFVFLTERWRSEPENSYEFLEDSFRRGEQQHGGAIEVRLVETYW